MNYVYILLFLPIYFYGKLQDGQIVVEIYSDWQRVLDILDNERFLTTNVKIVFDARGQDATDSLDAVIAQIP